jgi:hypothetical protein
MMNMPGVHHARITNFVRGGGKMAGRLVRGGMARVRWGADRGAEAIEWVGIIALVVAIVVALTQLRIGDALAAKVQEACKSINITCGGTGAQGPTAPGQTQAPKPTN